MSGRSTTRGIPAARNHELQVAAAVAREAVVQLHVDHALELIRHASGKVPELRMLEIYGRLLDLAGPSGDAVSNRVLAALGRTPDHAPAVADPADVPQHAADHDSALLQTLRRRLRGRVHIALRRTVELKTGVVMAALLDTHVSHARGFVELLADTHSIQEACTVYARLVPVPNTLASVLYSMVLDRIAAAEAPTAWSGAAAEAAPNGAREPRLAARAGGPPSRARNSA